MLPDWLTDLGLVLGLIATVFGIAEGYFALGVSAYVPVALFILIIVAAIIFGFLVLRIIRHFAQPDKPAKSSYETMKPVAGRTNDSEVNRETGKPKDKRRFPGSDAAEAQGKTETDEVRDELRLALRDDKPHVRQKAVEALKNIETEQALDMLKQALCDRDPSVRDDVAGILRSRGWKPKNDAEQALYLIAQEKWDEVIKLGEPAVKPLIQALDYDFYSTGRYEAAEALGNTGGPLASEALIQALRDQDWFLRATAAVSLGKMRDQRTLEPLINALTDPHWAVRLRAAESLGKLHFAKAKKPLRQVLEDKDGRVRRAAANSLDDLDWKPENDTDRAYYDIATFNFLLLPRLGEPAVQPLIQILRTDFNDTIENSVMSALVEIAKEIGDSAISPLIEALKDPIGHVRSNIAFVLEQVGKPAVPFLESAREDDNPNVREAAMNALARIDYSEQ